MNITDEVLVYEGQNIPSMNVLTDGETVWLTQSQMCQLFGRERSVITKHINNVFNEGELVKDLVCAKFAHTTRHGAISGKTQDQEVTIYNLDVAISVGYRVKSIEGTRFRQWATKCLREILLRNVKTDHRLEKVEERLTQVENGLAYLEEQISSEPELFYPEDRELIGFKPKK